MTNLTEQDYSVAKRVLMEYVHALLETVKESGTQGAPLGPVYLAFQTVGMSYDTFMQIIGALQDANQIKVTASSVAYYIGDLKT